MLENLLFLQKLSKNTKIYLFKKKKSYGQSKTVQFISYKNETEHINKTTTHIMESLKLVTYPK